MRNLPSGSPNPLRHLVVDLDGEEGFADWPPARRLRDLASLRFDGSYIGFSTVDLAPFSGSTGLRALDIAEPDVVGWDTIPILRELRLLRWKDAHLEHLEPLRGLAELRVL